MGRRDGRPAGISIGRAIVVPSGIVNDDLRDAVAAIDRVHGDGDLPSIQTMFVPQLADERGRDCDGLFVYWRIDPSQPFVPSIILVRSGASYRSFVATHEVGHFLDLCALPGPTFSSSSDPLLAEWRETVTASRAFVELEAFMGMPDAEVARRARDLIVFEELWARSYAQFVAGRSGSLPMQRALAALRRRDPNTLYFPRQWEDDDFDAIEAAIHGLFRGLGWIA
jgi:hypothetical protein